MKDRSYILELGFGEIYREVPLSGSHNADILIGTTRLCGVRLPRESFFEDFEICAGRGEDGRWFLECGENIYLSQDGILKMHRLDLHHGDSFTVHYQSSGAQLCRGTYYRSFPTGRQEFHHSVDLSNLSSLSIGGTRDCQIQISDAALDADRVFLNRSGSGWTLTERGTRYGVEVNGTHRNGSWELRDYDFFSVTGHSFFLRGERLYFCMSPEIYVSGVPLLEHRDSQSGMQYPNLIRSTRVYYKVPEEKIQLQKPKSKPTPPDRNLIATVLPLLVMLGVMVLLRSMMGGNGMFIIFSVCSMGVGVFTSVYNYFHQKKKTAQEEEKRVAVYTAYIQDKQQQIEQLRDRERELAVRNTPDIDRTMRSVWQFDGHLYERMPEHEDYVSVRVGTGEMDSSCPVDFKPEEYKTADDPLMDWPERVQEQYTRLSDMPVLLEMKDTGTVGIIGNQNDVYETVKLMTVDLAVHHSHQELQMIYILPEAAAESFSWVRWLRHATGYGRNIACDQESCKDLADQLYKTISDREAVGKDAKIPHVIVFVLSNYSILSHPISRFFTGEEFYGFTFVFCSGSAETLPRCRRLLRLDMQEPTLVDASDGGMVQTYHAERITDADAARVARKLACVEVDEVSLDSQLVKSITLFHLLNIFSAEDPDYAGNWASEKIFKTLAAPIGVDAKGTVVSLDLNEKAHGPHGLVAGTTGSGKSELLQTYIISMAALYHPHEVGFVIIDFKGGGMANQFRDLPHLIGTITNIDGREIQRSLKSIRAELLKRERLFAEAGVNNIDGYLRLYKHGQVKAPLPHLILVVDEFAELKAENPDFMKELVSASRIGRSLGVHLILATQKPSGVVDDQIWSNSRFHLCLKVQSPGDSNEMLKTPLAAEIKEPGRGYLQVGNNEIFTLFQSAYSGAPADSELTAGQHSYEINEVSLSGAQRCIFRQEVAHSQENAVTELQSMVESIVRCCEREGIRRLQGICLPPLPHRIPFPALAAAEGVMTVPLGVYDDPENQTQTEYVVSPTNQNIMIIGSSQSGKTNLLQTMIRGLSSRYSPREVVIYIIDCASMVLRNFEKLAHVGGVATSSEDEKIINLFKLLYQEIEQRKERLNSVGVSSFAAYREAGYTDLPQIVLMVDNLTALKELYFRDEDPLLGLCREGQTVGVCVVIANAQTSGIGYRYLSNFSCRIAMYCNDSSEYMALMDHCRERIDDIHGRCIVDIEKQHYECQTYLAFEGDREIERVEQIRDYIRHTNARWPNERAKQIPVIPALLTDQELWRDYGHTAKASGALVAGLDYATVEPMVLSLDQVGTLAITGKEGAGRHNWVRYVIRALERCHPGTSEVYLLDGVSRKLADLSREKNVKAYSILPDDAAAWICTMEERLKRRYDALLTGEESDDRALLVLVLDNLDGVDRIQADSAAQNAYRNIASRYKSLGVCVLLPCVPNENIPYSAPEMLKNIRDSHNAMFFGDLGTLKLFDLPLSVTKAFKKRAETGDGYFLQGSGCIKLKTPLCTSLDETLPEKS